MTTQVLATLPSSIDANLLKNRLENDGIECFLINDNFSNLMPIYYGMLGSGVQVVVRTEDFEKASNFIKPKTQGAACPSCGSSNIELKSERPKRKWQLLFIGILLSGLMGNLLTDYSCLDCSEEFRL